MASNWPPCSLAEVSCDISYGYTESASEQEIGPHFLRITDIQGGTVNWSKVPYCKIAPANHKKYKLEDGDIVVARTGNSTGENYIFTGEIDAVYASYLIRFRIDDSKASPLYVWYNMRSHSWWDYISNSKTGSAQAGANANILSRYTFPLPPLLEQKAIASTLGALDDKIDCNRRMNETLEAMARAMFKDWFVDFGPTKAKMEGRTPYLAPEIWDLFPDRLDDEGKPEGWAAVGIGEEIDLLDNRRIPLSACERASKSGKYPYHGATGIMDYVDDYLFDEVLLLLGEDGSVVRPDGHPYTQYVWGKIWVNNHAHVIKGKTLSVEQLKCFFDLSDIAPYVTGAVQPKLNQGNLKRIKFTKASSELHMVLDRIISPLFSQIRFNTEETKTLAQTRDLLLPKLMSGEIRVRDAERAVEEAL